MKKWTKTNLGDCCEIVSGSTPSTNVESFWNGNICWVTPKDLSHLNGAYISDTPRKLTQSGLDSCGASILPSNSVLFSSRAPIGHVAINSVPMATNQGFKSFIPKDNRVYSKFLYHWLRKNRAYLEGLGNGATFKEVSKSIVSRVEISLPPLEEQKRIAEILDRIQLLISKRKEAIAKLDTLTQSIFIEMFGDSVANPKNWDENKTLGEVSDIVSGITKGRKLNGQSVREVPYLAVVNVQDQKLDLSVIKTIEAKEDEIERYRLQVNDLVLTEGGDPDKLGRGTIWHGELPECIHQNHIFRVRIKLNELHPRFLMWLIGSKRGKSYFLKSAKQTTGIASINMTQLKGFPVLIPPLQLQKEFAQRVEAVEKLKATHRASLSQLEALFASLQHRAFRGEL
ncbi:restriction endonuclease subunit S [Pseudanabaena sp. 'Roaring Creek']|uniref:restriction endonuclease subunit S n=1 Tax=Pseudanabaena sp. 'Roaring Creek' TaxID=1681830 RepID=UPI00092FAD30|nr:restriction endonuclease subunit S [Pseudanabaena sp. 'Roaring Creek']